MKTILALALILFSKSALAETPGEIYQITQSGCKTFKFEGGQWKPAEPPAMGSQIHAKPHPSQPTTLIFQWMGVVHTYPVQCATLVAHTPVPEPTPVAPAAAQEAESTVSVQPTPPNSFHLKLALLSWQQALKLLDSSQTSYPLRASNLGVSLGTRWQIPLSYRWEFSFDGDFIYAQSEAADQTGETQLSSILYRVQNATVFGFQLSPGINWLTLPNATLGISIPLLYQKGNWPDPGSGYSLVYSNFIPGVQLNARFGGNPFAVVPKIGFLGSLASFFWSLELSQRL